MVDDELIGQTLGNKYEIQSEIGEGGMGKVYKAWHTVLGKAVAIKVPKRERCNDRQFVEAFIKEARLAAQLDHPNIVKINDVDEHDGIPYIVMEYVAGQNLRSMIRAFGAMPLDKICALFDQIAKALDYAHEQRIIHCDIKPSNILVDTGGRVKLVDFGIARAMVRAKGKQEEPKRSFGSPRYMSPEHVQGKELDARSDIYSLGIVLYEILTGTVPFDRGSSREIQEAHLSQPPVPPSKKRPGLPKGVDKVVLRALAKEPEKRYASAAQMASELRKVLFPRPFWPWLILIVAIIVFVLLVASYFVPSCNNFLIPVGLLTPAHTLSGVTLGVLSPTWREVVHTLTPTATSSVTSTAIPMRDLPSPAQATETATAQAAHTAFAQQTSTSLAKATSTAYALHTAAALATGTAAAGATRTALAQATNTAIALPTPSATVQAAVPQQTGTPTPSGYKYSAPQLSMPAKGATFTGYVAMEFSWQPVAPQLAADEYYALVITFLHRDGHCYPYLQATIKDTRWQGQLNPFLYDSDVLADRGLGWQHGWYVVVMRNPGTNDKGEIIGIELSPRSEERFFTWRLERETVSGPDARPTPTRTPKI